MRRVIEAIVLSVGIILIVIITNALNKPVFDYLISFIIIALIIIGSIEYRDEKEDFAQPIHTTPRASEMT